MAGARCGVRLSTAVRTQVEWQTVCLDDLIAEDHRARAVWDHVEGLDLSTLYGSIRSLEGEAGRPAIDPAILMSLWLYATLEGVGSARALDRLCETDLAYRWICGGVGVNYHTLSDFRVAAGPVLDELLSRSVAALVAADVVELACIAVDGVRVRASAGSGSFRSKPRLEELDRLAREKVAALRAEVDDDPGASSSACARAGRARPRIGCDGCRRRRKRTPRSRRNVPPRPSASGARTRRRARSSGPRLPIRKPAS